jgi:hypothetical protein
VANKQALFGFALPFLKKGNPEAFPFLTRPLPQVRLAQFFSNFFCLKNGGSVKSPPVPIPAGLHFGGCSAPVSTPHSASLLHLSTGAFRCDVSSVTFDDFNKNSEKEKASAVLLNWLLRKLWYRLRLGFFDFNPLTQPFRSGPKPYISPFTLRPLTREGQ